VTEFDKVILPGGEGKVTASLDTSHYKGLITKSVQVSTRETRTHPLVLVLKAEIVTVIDVAPSDTPVVRTTVGETRTTELTVSATDGQPFDILALKADPSLAAMVRPAPGTPVTRRKPQGGARPVAAGSSRYLLGITPTKDAALGQSIANVTLTTTRPNAETVSIRAILSVSGLVQVDPPQLVVRPGAEAPVVHVKIRKPHGSTLRILGVESSDPEFTPSTTTLAPGREYDLLVKYTGKPGRGRVSARITVKTNEPRQTAIVIPLTGSM